MIKIDVNIDHLWHYRIDRAQISHCFTFRRRSLLQWRCLEKEVTCLQGELWLLLIAFSILFHLMQIFSIFLYFLVFDGLPFSNSFLYSLSSFASLLHLHFLLRLDGLLFVHSALLYWGKSFLNCSLLDFLDMLNDWSNDYGLSNSEVISINFDNCTWYCGGALFLDQNFN